MSGGCKPDNILEKGWDVLIVLDACRYDVFESVYEDYLEGFLCKRRGACNTITWLNEVFPHHRLKKLGGGSLPNKEKIFMPWLVIG